MTVGICTLCLQTRPLLESHFLPAALYKNLLDPGGAIRNMIVSNQQTASEESKQVKQSLLCEGCEILLQQGGESWVLARRLMPDNSFVLREVLRQHSPAGTRDGGSLYMASTIPEVRPEQLSYFAASIFWRASVSDWNTPLGLFKRLPVSSEIKEGLRKLLLNEESFPDRIAILLMLSASHTPRQVVTLPIRIPTATQWEQFEFYIPGMNFAMTIGNDSLINVSLSRPPHVIAIDPKVDDRIEKAGREHAARSTPTDNLKKKLGKWWAELRKKTKTA